MDLLHGYSPPGVRLGRFFGIPALTSDATQAGEGVSVCPVLLLGVWWSWDSNNASFFPITQVLIWRAETRERLQHLTLTWSAGTGHPEQGARHQAGHGPASGWM